jgi:hypothetical protein
LVTGTVLLAGVLAPGLQGLAETLPGKPEAESITAAAARLGPEVRISEPTLPEANRYRPAIAYNWRHHEYLVVWHNKWPDDHRDIYARRVSESGELLSSFTITAGPNDRFQPAVAYNAINDEYLVAWMYNPSGDNLTYNIWCRTVAWNGSSMGPEREVIAWPNRSFWTPRVAWNNIRNEYMVVWTATDTATGVPTDVSHAILDATGTKVFGALIHTDYEPHQPDVTYNVATDEYLVVWRRMWGPADGDIRAARLGGFSGQVIDPPGVFTISAPIEDQLLPSVTTNEQHRYLVVWQHAFPGPCCDWDIHGRELDVTGNLLGDELSIGISINDETAPSVAARPGPKREYLAVWQRETAAGKAIYAYAWGDAGPMHYGDFASAAFWDNQNPVVAAGAPGFFVVYEGDAQGDPTVYQHIYGRRWVPNAIFLPLVVRNR